MTRLWYTSPAAAWTEALPLGNGHMGAMCFGGTLLDRWQLNDDTIWSGGFINRMNPDAAQGVKDARALIADGKISQAEEVVEEAIVATPDGQRKYEPLCDLFVQFRTKQHARFASPFSLTNTAKTNPGFFEPAEGVADYQRSLTLDEGLHLVSYTLDDQCFVRESFISYPARVMVIRMRGGGWRAMLRRNGQATGHRQLDQRTISL